MTVAICRYGAGNVRSVELALTRAGCTVDSGPDADVAGADLVVLPGVGSARSAMAGLVERGLDVSLRERVAAGRPVLGICLGLQLALDWTDEDGGVAGLGLVPGRAVRLTEGRVPRMGWASLDAAPPPPGAHGRYAQAAGAANGQLTVPPASDMPWGDRLMAAASGESTASPASDVPRGDRRTAAAASGESTVLRGTYYYAHSYAADSPLATAWSEGVAVEVRSGAFVGCQFHPEKSGPAGARYLATLLDAWRPTRSSAQLVGGGWSSGLETNHQPPIPSSGARSEARSGASSRSEARSGLAAGAGSRAGARGVANGAACPSPV